MKIQTKVKRFYKRNKMLSLGLAAAGAYWYMNRYTAPVKLQVPVSKAAAAPKPMYAYDSYPPVRNEPYYNSTHFFGPADGDPVFYGF